MQSILKLIPKQNLTFCASQANFRFTHTCIYLLFNNPSRRTFLLALMNSDPNFVQLRPSPL